MMGHQDDGGDILSLGGGPQISARPSDTSPPSLSSLAPDQQHSAGPAHSTPRDTTDLRELVRQAADSGTALRLAGAGRWMDAGRPVVATRRVDLRSLSGIVEYVPGDLTMTARAGSTLADLQEAARAEGQFLPLDPWGDDAGTLGATLATGTAGPHSAALGLPRDVVLGLSVVTGAGDLVRAGGRVVKNVAGFDLVRLMVGAWGTLGAITEASVRLRALPECDETLAIAAPIGGPAELALWLARLRAAPLQPLAMELLDHALARRLGVDANGADVLLVRIGGNADMVAAQRATIATFGDPVAAPADCWAQLRGAMTGNGVVVRLSAATSDLNGVWNAARELVAGARSVSERLAATLTTATSSAATSSTPTSSTPTSAASTSAASMMASILSLPDADRAFANASVMRGVVRIALPSMPEQSLLQLLGQTAPTGTRRIFEWLPAALWPVLAPSAVADQLSHRVRLAFDPRAILNPGILGVEHGTEHGRRHGSNYGVQVDAAPEVEMSDIETAPHLVADDPTFRQRGAP